MPRIWAWVSFVIFALVIALLSMALIKKQSPSTVLKSIFSSKSKTITTKDLSDLSKKELIVMVDDLLMERDSIKAELFELRDIFGQSVAQVNVDNNLLNMRSQPNLQGNIIFRIPNQAMVTIIEYDTDQVYIDGSKGRWCKVNYAGNIGWVWGNYLLLQ